MTYAEFVALVRAMRLAQRKLVSGPGRSLDDLAERATLEQRCDRAIKEFERGADLFEGEEG